MATDKKRIPKKGSKAQYTVQYVQYLLYCKKNILKNGLKMYILNSFVGVDHTE